MPFMKFRGNNHDFTECSIQISGEDQEVQKDKSHRIARWARYDFGSDDVNHYVYIIIHFPETIFDQHNVIIELFKCHADEQYVGCAIQIHAEQSGP